MKRVLAVVFAALMLAGILTGCASKDPSDSESKNSGSGKTAIAICMGTINHPVHRIAQMGFVTKAQELGYNGIVAGLDEGSTQDLIAKFESIITTGVSGCLMWAPDDSYYEMMRKMSDQCVFVVPHFAHTYLDTKGFISRNITCLPSVYGRQAAEFLVEKLAEKGITSGALIVTQAGPNVTENAANDAFRARIAEMNVNFTIEPTIHEGLEVLGAAAKITGAIQGSKTKIVGAFGTTGGSCQAWSLAKQDTNRPDILVVGVDYTEFNVELVRNGEIAAIVAQPLIEECEQSAESIVAVLNGTDYTGSEEEWFLEMDGPLAYIGGEGTSDIEYYVPIIDRVLAYFAD